MCASIQESIPRLLTVSELAEQLGVSTHRLKYAIEQYKIEPTRRVGIIRVWAEDKVPQIVSALASIAAHRARAEGEQFRS
jgi:DNA-binding transcriptional MerR regulator